MSVQYRYPGTRPFQINQQHIFFGRQKDVKRLSQLIGLEQVVVLYSKSGLGKSSLMNAGVIPEIEKQGRMRTITIRFGAYTKENPDSPVLKTMEFLKSAGPDVSLVGKLGLDDESIWACLKALQGEDQKDQFLLVFDQFEELFTYPSRDIVSFKKALAEVLYSAIPQRYRDALQENREQLNTSEIKIFHKPLNVKVVMAIRSDRISHLDEIADFLPVKRAWYELKSLSRMQAEDAILLPAFMKGDFKSPIFDYSDEAIESLLTFLTENGEQEIESSHLQIVCQSAERKVIDRGLKIVGVEDIGDLKELFENYYEDQLRPLGTADEILAARKLMEEGLIYEDEKRRVPLYSGQILNTYGLNDELLQKLVDTHLIRREPSARGGFTYELSHDSLVDPVLKAKMRRTFIEESKARKEEFRKNQEALAEESRKLRRARIWAVLGFILAVSAMAAGGYAFIQKDKAEAATLEALIQTAKAEAATSEALKQTARAEAAEIDAKRQTTIAEGEKRRAEEATAEAIIQKNNAEAAKIDAINQKNEAEAAKIDAINQTNIAKAAEAEAIIQTIIAEGEKKNAEEERIKAEEAEMAAQKARYQAMTSNLSFLSKVEHEEGKKAYLAMQAYYLNQQYNDDKWNSEIIEALWGSMPNGSGETVIHDPTENLDFIKWGEKLYYLNGKGELIFKEHSKVKVQPIGPNFFYKKHSLSLDKKEGILQFTGLDGMNYCFDAVTLERKTDGAENCASFREQVQIDTSLKIAFLGERVLPHFWKKNEIITAEAVSDDQKYLAVGMQNGWMYVLDLTRDTSDMVIFNRQHHEPGSRISDIDFDENSVYLASGGLDGSVLINRISDLAIRRFAASSHSAWVNCIQLLEDDNLMIGTQDGLILKFNYNQDRLASDVCTGISSHTVNVQIKTPIDSLINNNCIN